MTLAELAYEQITTLSETQARQVVDFIGYLKEKSERAAEKTDEFSGTGANYDQHQGHGRQALYPRHQDNGRHRHWIVGVRRNDRQSPGTLS